MKTFYLAVTCYDMVVPDKLADTLTTALGALVGYESADELEQLTAITLTAQAGLPETWLRLFAAARWAYDSMDRGDVSKEMDAIYDELGAALAAVRRTYPVLQEQEEVETNDAC